MTINLYCQFTVLVGSGNSKSKNTENACNTLQLNAINLNFWLKRVKFNTKSVTIIDHTRNCVKLVANHFTNDTVLGPRENKNARNAHNVHKQVHGHRLICFMDFEVKLLRNSAKQLSQVKCKLNWIRCVG